MKPKMILQKTPRPQGESVSSLDRWSECRRDPGNRAGHSHSLCWDKDLPKEQKRMGRTVSNKVGLGSNSLALPPTSLLFHCCLQVWAGEVWLPRSPEVQICLKKGKKDEAALYCFLEFVPISTSFLLQVSGSFSIRQV